MLEVDAKALISASTEAFKAVLDIFTKENSIKFNKLDKQVADLKSEIGELRRSLEYSQRDIDEYKQRITVLESDKIASEKIIKEIQNDLENAIKRQDYMEDQQRRDNLVFGGISEDKNESWEQSELKVKELIRNRLGVTGPVDIERAHRIGRFQRAAPGSSNRPRNIVAKFSSFRVRDNVLRNASKLKGNRDGLFISEDLCKASRTKRQEQLAQLKQAKNEGLVAYFSYTTLKTRERGPSTDHHEESRNNGNRQGGQGNHGSNGGRGRVGGGRGGGRGGATRGAATNAVPNADSNADSNADPQEDESDASPTPSQRATRATNKSGTKPSK